MTPLVTTVDVRVLDLADADALRRWYDLSHAAEIHERPWATTWSHAEMVVEVRDEDPAHRWELLAAYDGEHMVGAAMRILPQTDNTEKVYAGVFVPPAHAGRGVGGALVEAVVARTRADGRREVLVDAGIPTAAREDHPTVSFARRHGFAVASVEVHRQLDLPLPDGLLAELRAEAAPYHVGYRVETYMDRLPEEVLEGYCALVNQLAVDAPTGEVEFEAESHTPQLQRRAEARMREQGRHMLTSLAFAADGEAVAVTDLMVPAEDRPKAHQWATLVRRDHRGHRLGTAVKVANLQRLGELFPDRTEVHTTNEESNAAMIGINERLGFRKVEICPTFRRLV